jgi:Ser/Thr protein kinase RdoA (MazF antagonist)
MSSPDPIPVIRSIVSPVALRLKVAQSYDVGTPVECRLLKRGLNDTYLLTTLQRLYVLRVYRAGWRSEEEIRYELDLLRHLAARGVAVSVPVAAHGDRLTLRLGAPEGARYLVLFTYANGTRAPWSVPEDAYRVGAAAAAIHAASDDFATCWRRPSLEIGYLTDQALVAIRPFLAHRPADCAFLEQFVDRLKERATALVAQGLDWGVCHGDFGLKNIHRDSEGRLTVFDFDLCGPGWRALDLALMRWVAVDHKNESLWEAFVRGYADARFLSAADFAAVPMFHAAAHLSSLGLFAQNIGDWGSADMSDWLFDRELQFFRTWETENSYS